jgi:RNA polymerase sigma factor
MLPRDASENMRLDRRKRTNSTGMVYGESALALRAKTDERAREELIIRQEKNILRIVSLSKRSFATKSDDEWAIALCAFSHAIDTYLPEKGAFVPYAETLIKRSLIDEYRARARHAQELVVSPDAFDGELEEGIANPVLAAVVSQSERRMDTMLRDEIAACNSALKRLGFSFFDLTDCSPARESTREACLTVAEMVLANREFLAQTLRTRKLPLKQLADSGIAPKKLMERYRKYILAMVVICAGEFPALERYVRGRGRNHL